MLGSRPLVALTLILLVATGAAGAVERMTFTVSGGNKALEETLKSVSLTWPLRKDEDAQPQDVLGAALADYRVLVEALYAAGHYGGTVKIRVDGIEAAEADIFAQPEEIRDLRIAVDPGPLFAFGRVSIGPEPQGLAADPALDPGEPALSPLIAGRTQAVIEGWRSAGHPKATVLSQSVVADHRRTALDVTVRIEPGPQAVFGELIVEGDSAVRADKIRRIAGLKAGTPFSPEVLDQVAARLRRTGAFSSVSLAEADQIKPDGSLDITATVSDRARHRFGLGAELDSVDGVRVSGFWLNRNLFGGAELFRVDAEVSNIASENSGADYTLGARLENPSRRRVDTVVFYRAEYEYHDEPNYLSESVTLGFGFSRIFNANSRGQVGIDISDTNATDDLGTRDFTIVSLPASANLDHRDNPLDPGRGFYLEAGLTPFHDFANEVTGLRGAFDARAYHLFSGKRPVTVAGRVQLGALTGAEIAQVEPDMLFFSGGGGTVRGQPYQSLGVDLGGGVVTGGRSFLGLSAEARMPVWGDVGAAIFADAGYIGSESFPDGSGDWHAGAGLGLRYFTSLGPIRADFAWPVGGDTGGGMQLYIGIGQAF